MADACILMKSPRAQTYRDVADQLWKRYPHVRSVEWLFVKGATRDDTLVASIPGAGLTTTIASIDNWDDLPAHLGGARYCDASGLPKEDFAHVLALALGRRGMHLCTLTGDPKVKTDYIDLLSQPTLKAFNRSYIAQLAFFRAFLGIAACGIVALALLKVTDWIPNSDRWLTWVALALSVLGVVVSYAGLRKQTA